MSGWEASAERAADVFGRAVVVLLLLALAAAVVFGAVELASRWRPRP